MLGLKTILTFTLALLIKLIKGGNMIMNEKITLDDLTNDSVSLKKQQYTVVDGKEYPIGEPWRRAYVNSVKGRAQVQEEVSEPYKSAIMAVWGDTPTVTEQKE